MRYLAILLLLPWLVILSWVYWGLDRKPSARARRLYDLAAIVAALLAGVLAALYAFDHFEPVGAEALGQASGGIWQLVQPVVWAYAAFNLVLGLAWVARCIAWRGRG